ncbi:MAG: hypothetical protein JWP87_6232 [Labilithrix sp.]|nr:hypothetical protein [Labilithrix sp.]
MRRSWLSGISVVAWIAALPLAQGCSDDAKEDERPTTIAGSEIVRGVVGATGPSAESGGDARLREVADALAAEIEAEAPGRLAQIAADLRSRDGERVVAAKVLLDSSIASAVESRSFAARANGGGLVTPQSLRPLGEGMPLVDAGQQLLCEHPKGADGQPLHLGQQNGRYGDDRSGAGGALRDTGDLVDTTDVLVLRTLNRVDSGELTPDPDSRLGAYAATRGYPPGTTGNAVHNAIGTIYVTFANYGQEKIGRVFDSPEARALYDQPVASCAGMQMALLEYQYWQDVAREDGFSPGGRMGSMFNPSVRNFLQTNVFVTKP